MSLRLVNHLVRDRDVARTLNDPDVVVIEARENRGGEPPGDAPLERAPILRSIGAPGPGSAAGRCPRLSLGRQRRNSSVGRIHNQRRSLVVENLSSGVGPVRRMNRVGRDAIVRGFVETSCRSRLELIRLVRRQELAAGEILGSFERRDGLVVPHALQVGIAPRGAWRPRLVPAGGGRRRLRAAGR